MAIANTTLILRKSGTPGVAPSALANGEIALNYADGRLYYKNASGAITYIANGSSSSGGSSSNSFATINANSSLILATSSTDTLSIVPGNNITITTNTTSKTITINSTASGGGGSASGYQANTILVANSTGYISNSNLFFTVSNNNLIVANSIIAGGGTGGNISGANNISANTITLGTGFGGSITGANVVSANTVNVTTALIFPDGSIQYTANTDSYARANIALLFGIELSQNANIVSLQTLANTDYTTLSASAGVYGNSTYVPVITLAANGRVTSIVNTAIAATGGASLSGYVANTILVANSAGYVSNSNLYFTVSNNNLIVANSIIAGGGTGGNISGANNISANTITLGTGYGGNISGANIISANTVNVATSLIFPDGTIQYTANTDSYARGAITSANANIALLFAIDNAQNTTIQTVYNQANLANSIANTALQNTSNIITAGSLTVTGNLTVAGNIVFSNTTINNVTLNTTDQIITTNASPSTSNTTGSLIVYGGAGIKGNVYSDRIYTNGLFWASNGNVISTGAGSSGPVNTSAPTPPATGNNVNDTWYNTTTDVLYRYTYDGTSYYWVDINGPTVLANSTYSTISSSRAIAFSLIFGG